MRRLLPAAVLTLATALLPAPADAHSWTYRYSGNVLRATDPGHGCHQFRLRDYAGDSGLMLVKVDYGEGGKRVHSVPHNGAVVEREFCGAWRFKLGETNLFTGERTWKRGWRSY